MNIGFICTPIPIATQPRNRLHRQLECDAYISIRKFVKTVDYLFKSGRNYRFSLKLFAIETAGKLVQLS